MREGLFGDLHSEKAQLATMHGDPYSNASEARCEEGAGMKVSLTISMSVG